MKGHGKEMITSTFLAAILIVSLVLSSAFIASNLGEHTPIAKAYATNVTIQNVGSLTEDLINEILSAGGGYMTIDYLPEVTLLFENGSRQVYVGETHWTNEWTINVSELEKIWVEDSTLATYGCYSDEFVNFTQAGNFTWYGNYNKGSEIQSSLQMNGETIDLGTKFETNIIFIYDLNAETMLSPDKLRFPADDYGWDIPPELRMIRRENGSWSMNRWRMESSHLVEMVGQSESASILFDGSVWVGGNYAVTVNGVTRYETINLTRNVSFGKIDMAFKDGRISTLSWRFNAIRIILFAYPEE